MKAFFSIVLAIAVSISTAVAKHGKHGKHGGHGGYHGKHSKYFSSRSARGGHKFSRGPAAAHREDTATGEAATGAAVIGAAIGGIIDSPVTDSSTPVDMVIRTTGIGTLLGAGAFHTRTTAIIRRGIIFRMTVAPYQEGNSLGPDSDRAIRSQQS